jgi:hypothetical protein
MPHPSYPDLSHQYLSDRAGVSLFIVVHSPITKTESMEKFRPNIVWMKGRESGHQLQIIREN